MRITRAERGFLLLAEPPPEADALPEPVARPARCASAAAGGGRDPARRGAGALELGRAQGAARPARRWPPATPWPIPSLGTRAERHPHGPAHDRLHPPALAARARRTAAAAAATLGAIYVDNPETSAPFSAESLRTAEALARHAALAIENAQLFEREQRTIEELRQAQKQLLQSEKLATIGQMAAGIAHELNTPLTYIMGNLELLQAQPLTDGPAGRCCARSATGAERIKGLAQSLLAFSRPAQEEPVAAVRRTTSSSAASSCATTRS